MPTFRQVLTPTAWVNIGPGPLYMQNRDGDDAVYYIIDAADPVVPASPGDIADTPQLRLGGEGEARDISINFTQNVYVRGRGSVYYAR